MAGEKASELGLQLTSSNIQQVVLNGLHSNLDLYDNVLYSDAARHQVEVIRGHDETDWQAVSGDGQPPQLEGTFITIYYVFILFPPDV
jgi:hypothetical protein